MARFRGWGFRAALFMCKPHETCLGTVALEGSWVVMGRDFNGIA